ncbi:copper homeostasis protein CutC [Agarivorans sp.]|uniref:copper homeostasis protein CutC n=1 Tax=Agarivorans sp. TaxID=1872412 RepID=UPI003D04E5D8
MPSPSIKTSSLEICCYSIADIKAAIVGGADRVEFCAGQTEGGTSPSYGALKQASKYLADIDIVVMLRPRGGDFCYDADELEQMQNDLEVIKTLGFSGVVLGVLNHDATVNLSACQRLIDSAEGLAVTFHRAFDCVAEPYLCAEQLAELGIKRILSSGQQNSAEQGAGLLQQLQQDFQQIEWLVAGGVRPHNIGLLKQQGFRHFHSAAAKALTSPFDSRYSLAMASKGDAKNELQRSQVCQQQVLEMSQALRDSAC